MVAETQEPTVPWQDVLKDFLVSHPDRAGRLHWKTPNRRFIGQGIYLAWPAQRVDGHVVIAVDTSGSIDEPRSRRSRVKQRHSRLPPLPRVDCVLRCAGPACGRVAAKRRTVDALCSRWAEATSHEPAWGWDCQRMRRRASGVSCVSRTGHQLRQVARCPVLWALTQGSTVNRRLVASFTSSREPACYGPVASF